MRYGKTNGVVFVFELQKRHEKKAASGAFAATIDIGKKTTKEMEFGFWDNVFSDLLGLKGESGLKEQAADVGYIAHVGARDGATGGTVFANNNGGCSHGADCAGSDCFWAKIAVESSAMTTQEAFLEVIVAHIDEDAPRLIYADWLEEHGDPARAEFIRVQCRIARGELPDCTYGCPRDDCLRCQLHHREKELLNRHVCKWLSNLPPGILLPILPNAQYECFRRGFVAEIVLSVADWIKHRDAILKTTPLEKVNFTASDMLSQAFSLKRGQKVVVSSNSKNLVLSFDNKPQGYFSTGLSSLLPLELISRPGSTRK